MADRSVKVVLSANVQGLVGGMKTAQRATQDYAKSATTAFRENEQQLDQMGTAAFRVGAGLTAVAGFAVKSAMDWETAWTGVLKTVDGTGPQLAKLEDGLRNLAKETGFAHSEVAAVGEAAGQLGISTSGIEAFTETMLAMGVSTNLSSEEAATGLARFRNIMGSTEGEIANMGSSIVGLGNNFATTEAEILEMGLRLAGAGRQAGLSESDVLGLAAAMSSVGIEAEAGGTALSMTLKRIGAEVDTGGDKLQMFADVAGMSVGEFSAAWKDDAAGALTSFVAGLDEASASGESVNAILTELGITGIREADALLRLSGNAEGLADAVDMSSESWRQNIALMAEADKFYGTTTQRGKQAWASIKDSAIDAGDSLLPAVASIADGVSGLAGAFGSLPGPVKGGVTAIAGIGGVSLLAVAGLIKLAGAVVSTRDAFSELTITGGKTGRIVAGLTRATFALAAFSTVQAAGESLTKRNAKEVAGLAKELQTLGKSGEVGSTLKDMFGKDLEGKARPLMKDLRGLGETLREFDKYGDDNFATRLGRRVTGNGGEMYRQVETIRDMDAALAKLSKSDPEAAIQAFERIRDSTDGSAESLEQLERAFPSMSGLLTSASEAMGGSADSAQVLKGSLDELGPAAQASAEEVAAMTEAATVVGESFLDMGESLKGSMTDFAGTLEKQTSALRDFRLNAAEALRRGADETLVDYLISKGPEGAAMLAQLADGTRSAVEDMNDAWRGGREELAEWISYQTGVRPEVITEFKTAGADDAIDTAVQVANAANLTPEEVETILRALDYSSEDIRAVLALLRRTDNTDAKPKISAQDNASSIIASIQAARDRLSDKSITITTRRRELIESASKSDRGNEARAPRTYTGGRVPAGYAMGGRVPGTPPADPRQDNVLAITSRGNPLLVRSREWIINEKQSDANDEWLAAINAGLNLDDVLGSILNEIPGFAAGGRLEELRAEARVRDLTRDLREREKYGKKPKKGKDTRKSRYVLRGLDRRIAQEELKEAKAELADLRKPESQREDAVKGRADAAESFSSFADMGKRSSFSSPASVERGLSQAIADMATMTTLLIALKKKGAAPWLLQQLQAQGPSKAAIRLARKYLADDAALARVNAQAAQLATVSGLYAQVTTDPQFSSPKAWSGGLSSSDTKTLEVLVKTLDSSVVARETTRQLTHELETLAVGAGL